MNDVQKICLSCKHFRLENAVAGICRVDKKEDKNYPQKDKNDNCLKWFNCGQQYYIRLGWIKAKTNSQEE